MPIVASNGARVIGIRPCTWVAEVARSSCSKQSDTASKLSGRCRGLLFVLATEGGRAADCRQEGEGETRAIKMSVMSSESEDEFHDALDNGASQSSQEDFTSSPTFTDVNLVCGGSSFRRRFHLLLI